MNSHFLEQLASPQDPLNHYQFGVGARGSRPGEGRGTRRRGERSRERGFGPRSDFNGCQVEAHMKYIIFRFPNHSWSPSIVYMPITSAVDVRSYDIPGSQLTEGLFQIDTYEY